MPRGPRRKMSWKLQMDRNQIEKAAELARAPPRPVAPPVASTSKAASRQQPYSTAAFDVSPPPVPSKRNHDDAESLDKANRGADKKRKRRKKEKAKAAALAAAAEEDQEEGEIDEFADMIMLDATPSVVKPEMRYEEGIDSEDDEEEDEGEPEDENALLRQFANEVQDSDDDEASDLTFGPDSLQQDMEGKIADDTAAKVTGRYYKEDDMTKQCGLCGETGHVSRDCTHSQCFTCGEVDATHDSRFCPLAMACGACGSRGHIARNCPLPPEKKMRFGARCEHCGSGIHATVNCPSNWRIYDTKGAKPRSKPQITFACSNCGSTKDHFVDDCPFPRDHPMQRVDPSAFNREALGSSAPPTKRPPTGGPGAAAAANRRRQYADANQDDDDDDWFASRRQDSGRKVGNGGGGGGGGKFARGNDHQRWSERDSWNGGKHTHFSNAGERDNRRYDSPGYGGGGARERYESPVPRRDSRGGGNPPQQQPMRRGPGSRYQGNYF